MTYNEKSDRLIYFGGRDQDEWFYPFNDTWEYDIANNTWINITPDSSPSNRSVASMAYDSFNDKTVLFGGMGSSEHEPYFLSDTWTAVPGIQYSKIGSYISKPYDTGGNSYYGTIQFNVSTPEETQIEFQIRTSNSLEQLILLPFVGPQGLTNSYYNVSTQVIDQKHNGSRYIQYKAYFSTSDIQENPKLMNVSINYNLLQKISINSPLGGENWTSNHNITWAAYDDDNDKLAFDIFLENESESILLAGELSNVTREWSWNTSAIPNGTYRIRMTALDDNPSIPLTVDTTSKNFTIYHPIPPPPPNHLPHVNLISPMNNSIINSTTVYLIWNGTDLDGDLLTYICQYSDNTQMQNTIVSNSTKEEFYDIMNLTDNTTYYWTVDADDGIINHTDIPAEIWNFTVKLPHPPVNHPPRITSIPPSIVMVGDSYDYYITVVDEDNDILIFSVIQAPNSLSLNSSSGHIHWMPNISDIGNHTIIVNASDGQGGFDQQTFDINVIPKPPPEKPRCVITYPTNGSKVGGMVSVKGTAINGSSPITLIQVRIDGADWVNAIGFKNWRAIVDMGKLSNGKHTIKARAFDGNLYSDTVSVGFNVYNPEPLITVEGALWWIAIIIVLVAIGVIFVAIHQSQQKGPPKRT
jgi:hypothetical protein